MTAYFRPHSDDPAEISTSPAVQVTIDGEPVTARAGQTIAAVLLAQGRTSWRTTRSTARPRGVFCAIGACHDCLVIVNGTPDTRACQRTIQEGDAITAQPGAVLPHPSAPSPEPTTPNQPPDTAHPTPAQAQGPTRTREQRFALNRPSQSIPDHPRRTALNEAPQAARGPAMDRPPKVADVVVVGAGPAGIAAALAAADAGVDVVLIDSGRAVGGQFNRQLPVEFNPRRPGKLQHGWKGFAERRDRVGTHPRITHLAESSVWAIEGLRLWVQRGPADAVGREVFAVDAKAVVLATGAYDRVLPFPGWDLPGVYSAGAAQALAKGQRISVGKRVIVAGTGPFLLPVAESLVGVGAHVVGLLEANSLKTVRQGWATDPLVASSKLREGLGYGALLARHRIPLRHGWTVIAAHGTDYVEAVTIARLDDNWNPIAGTDRRVEVDAVCLGFGFTAQLELAVSAHCDVTTGPDGGPAVTVDGNQQTTTPGIYAAGELTGIGGADLSTAEGQVAGTAAAHHARSPKSPPQPPAAASTAVVEEARAAVFKGRRFAVALGKAYPVREGWRGWSQAETVVCRCEEVTRGRLKPRSASGAWGMGGG